MPRNSCMRYFLAGAGIILLDQLVKHLTRISLSVGDAVPVIGDFFMIRHIFNTGAAFGMLAGKTGLLVLISAVLIVIVAYLLRTMEMNWIGKLSVVMIAAGGISNMIDRIVQNGVTDMFSFSIFPPVFNVADIFVCVGCGLLALYVILGEKETESESK